MMPATEDRPEGKAATATDFSVVIPAYNEQERILQSLQQVRAYCRQAFPRHEVVVVDDGSQDHTLGLVRELSGEWPNLRLLVLKHNRGKGYATRTGVLAARGEWILCSDADLSTPIQEVEKLLGRREACPVVIGSRSIPGALVLDQPWYRNLMGRTFNWMVQVLLLKAHADTQCGFKLFRRDVAHDIFRRVTIDGFAYDVEVLYLAHRLGHAVCEVPVVWRNDGRSKVRLWSDPSRMLLDLLRIRWRHPGRR